MKYPHERLYQPRRRINSNTVYVFRTRDSCEWFWSNGPPVVARQVRQTWNRIPSRPISSDNTESQFSRSRNHGSIMHSARKWSGHMRYNWAFIYSGCNEQYRDPRLLQSNRTPCSYTLRIHYTNKFIQSGSPIVYFIQTVARSPFPRIRDKRSDLQRRSISRINRCTLIVTTICNLHDTERSVDWKKYPRIVHAFLYKHFLCFTRNSSFYLTSNRLNTVYTCTLRTLKIKVPIFAGLQRIRRRNERSRW